MVFFLSPLQTCGVIGGDASQNLTLLQEEGSLRFSAVDGKNRNISPNGTVSPQKTKQQASPLQDSGKRLLFARATVPSPILASSLLLTTLVPGHFKKTPELAT